MEHCDHFKSFTDIFELSYKSSVKSLQFEKLQEPLKCNPEEGRHLQLDKLEVFRSKHIQVFRYILDGTLT